MHSRLPFKGRKLSEIESSIQATNKAIRKSLGGTLEGKLFLIFPILVIFGISLSIFSLNTTGYIVSNSIRTTPGSLGILFFIFGLIGIFFTRRKF